MYKSQRYLILAFLRIITYQTLPQIEFAEPEENPKMNTAKPNCIYIVIQSSL